MGKEEGVMADRHKYRQYPITATVTEMREIARKEICRNGCWHAYVAVRRAGADSITAGMLVLEVFDTLRSRTASTEEAT